MTVNSYLGEAAVRIPRHVVTEPCRSCFRSKRKPLVCWSRFVARFAARRLALSLLVCNAGVMGGPRRTTIDGLEMQFQVGSDADFPRWQGPSLGR